MKDIYVISGSKKEKSKKKPKNNMRRNGTLRTSWRTRLHAWKGSFHRLMMWHVPPE